MLANEKHSAFCVVLTLSRSPPAVAQSVLDILLVEAVTIGELICLFQRRNVNNAFKRDEV